MGKFLQKLWCCVSGDCSRFGLHHSIEKHCNNFSDDKNSLQKCVGFWRKNDWFVLKSFLQTYQLFAPYFISQESTSGLVKPEEFTPYDPTQDAIFPPELMVSQLAKQVQFHYVFQANGGNCTTRSSTHSSFRT